MKLVYSFVISFLISVYKFEVVFENLSICPFVGNHRLLVICLNDRQKGKEEKHPLLTCSLALFVKHGVVALATYIEYTRKVTLWASGGMCMIQKEKLINITVAIQEDSQYYSACFCHCYKETGARFRPGESMYLLSILSTLKDWDGFPKCVKENDQRKKEAKEKHPWVQLKHQPAQPREAHFVRTSGKDPELLEPVPYECIG